MADARTRSVPLGVPTLVGFAGLAGMLGLGGEAWQLAVSGLLAALLTAIDIARTWSAVRGRTGAPELS
ncbi:hypothetical protein [Pseudonocardia sp. KRD291]|uniref:hypothetical protein n=1 Tax=Pseudonocardia sp. KRD291 TaxID=2792007 RepID=UPI001C49D5C9|nr:hypothetical protein [Pseudonocardia sp. KRD291]MBW0102125.1 hypothetical protein [Pseudonocardia sp. KRD291]